ncbi:MAG TPA: divalent-cation tolerance protein CutA [Candidatus Limnocylindria bacterium]|nr:divalent-cation tolerance protein CutA [Candidatus Limnocylindria bacterium]
MKTTSRHFAVFVTCPDVETARRLAMMGLEATLCACAQILPAIESHYWWQGKREQSREILVIFKTTKARLPALEKAIKKGHPYEVPQIVVLPIASGSASYLAWLDSETKPIRRR